MSNGGTNRQRKPKHCPQCNSLLEKKTPESKFYDTVKEQQVDLVFIRDGIELTATLLWVDRYTLGIEVNNSVERLVNKSSLESIELHDHAMRKRHDNSGATP